MSPARRVAVAAVLTVGLAAGCGSTVATSSSGGASPGTTADGLSAPASVSGTTPDGATGGTGSISAPSAGILGAGASTGGTRTTAHTASSSTPGSGTAVGVTPVADGPGVTDTTITIGLTYYQSAEAANAALGAKGVDTGDPVAQAHILIKEINRTGGIAGRKVVPLLYGVDPQSSTPYATEAQAECTYFTEDHKSLAVIDGTPALDARSCLAQHGVADFRGMLVSAALAPNEIDAYTVQLDRAFTALVPALARQGWFGGWNRVTAQPGATRAKIGIVTQDQPDHSRAVYGVLIPALRAAGYAPNPADVIRIAPPGGFSDDGATVAAIDNAALKLNADGVDHVILDDDNGSLSLLFNNYAYSQNYFPRYGGTSGNGWQVLMAAGDLQAKTLHGAMGIGWKPVMDVPFGPGSGNGPYANAARRHCFDVFRRAGMPHTDATTAIGDAEGCDVIFLVQAIFSGYDGPVNMQVLLNRVDALGTSYPLASGFSSRFSAEQHDGTGTYVTMQFANGCGCIQYTGSPQPMPR